MNNNSRLCRNSKCDILSPVNIHNNLIIGFWGNIKEIGGTIYGNYSWIWGLLFRSLRPFVAFRIIQFRALIQREVYKMDIVRNRSAYGRYRTIVMNEIFKISVIIRFMLATSLHHQLSQVVKLWKKEMCILRSILLDYWACFLTDLLTWQINLN